MGFIKRKTQTYRRINNHTDKQTDRRTGENAYTRKYDAIMMHFANFRLEKDLAKVKLNYLSKIMKTKRQRDMIALAMLITTAQCKHLKEKAAR